MKADKRVVLGMEIAGNRATVALIDRHGRVLQRCYAKTLWGRPATATLEPYLRAIESMLLSAHAEGLAISGLGISLPGSLDSTLRSPLSIPTLPSLNGFPLCDLLEARYHLPTQLHIDVDAALLGEQYFGAGKGFQRTLFLTVNAVVGAALIIDGKIERSAPQYIGHISHIPVSTSSSGPRCSCGSRGCINTLVSADALQKMVQRALRRGESTSITERLRNHEYFSPQLLAEEAVRGDGIALQVYDEVGRWLGAAVAKYMQAFELDVLILGGGVLRASELLLTRVRSALSALMKGSSAENYSLVEVVPAQLGADSALIGTAIPFLPRIIPQRTRQAAVVADVAYPQSRVAEHPYSAYLAADDTQDEVDSVEDSSDAPYTFPPKLSRSKKSH